MRRPGTFEAFRAGFLRFRYSFFLKRNCEGVMPQLFLKICMKCFSCL